jgi:shikimate kinase
MGSGKSTIGKLLAERLAYDFIDTDVLIESSENRYIFEIFNSDGEEYFRQIEHLTILNLLQSTHTVIATGGGLPCYHGNIDIMNDLATTIYLEVSTNDLVSRLITHSHRPLVYGKSEKELYDFIEKTIAIREEYYTKADYTVNANIPTNLVLKEILEIIGQA